MSQEVIQELFERLSKGTAVAAVAQALFPALEELKEHTFREFAYAQPDPLMYAKIAGKAVLVDLLIRTLQAQMEEGKLASEELQQTGGH